MAKKIFTNKNYPEIVYEVVDEGWIDDDTYVIVFNDMIDVDGDTYHLEVEYHKDESRITYTRAYDHENVEASSFVTPYFKKQFEDYILHQCGVLRENGYLRTQDVVVELKLDVPNDISVGDYMQWINDLTITVEPKSELVRILEVKNKGRKE